MNEKEILTKKFRMISQDEIGISDDEKIIIGTEGLAPCVSFILYNKDYKKAIVGHISCNRLLNDIELNKLRLDIFQIVLDNQLIGSSFDLYLMEGAYKSQYKKYSYELEILNNGNKKIYTLLEILEENIKAIKLININYINRNNLSNNDFQIVDSNNNFSNDERHDLSKRFAFNAFTGEFVTDKVLFGEDYIKTNKKYKT